MFVCEFGIYFIEISFLLTDVSRYVTISTPVLGTKQKSNGKLLTLSTLNGSDWVDADLCLPSAHMRFCWSRCGS